MTAKSILSAKTESGSIMNMSHIVSFDDEMLIIVDETDTILDYKSKAECHRDNGILHRAFSLFIFNGRKELILQQRSGKKLLWPLFWSNTCCSHPRKGEDMNQAIHRRLREELGISSDLKYLYKFQYQAKFRDVGSENEICSVYIGKSEDAVTINKNEIAGWRLVSIPALTKEITKDSGQFTPWFKLEWQRITAEYLPEIDAL
jgi:isopentenyl-diphosphate delta-isomerase